MKMLINASGNFVLMIVKSKDDDKSKDFKGCDPKHKDELAKYYFLTMMNCFRNYKHYNHGERYNIKFICRKMHHFLTLECTSILFLRMNK